MKIAYLARRAIPSRHAHAVQIVKMCEAFGKLGNEVDLFATPGEVPAETVFDHYGVDRTFRIHQRPSRNGPAVKWRHVLAILRAPQVRGADLLFGRDILSLLACSRMGIPLVFEAHIMPERGSGRWRKLRRLFSSPNFSHLVCVTSTLAERYRAEFPALQGRQIMVVPNAAAEVTSSSDLNDWPGRPEATQVGFVGRPFPGKGIELVAAAAIRLPSIDFHVVGAEAADLHWIGQRLPANLHLHGYRPHGELGAYYRRFDIAVAPYGAQVLNASKVESAAITSPLKLLEYMAAGLPIIVSDLPGVRDIIADESGVVIVPPGDLEAFVEQLQRLSADVSLRDELGTAARRSYLANHTAVARAERVLAPLQHGHG